MIDVPIILSAVYPQMGFVNLSIDKRNLMSFQEKSVSRKTIQDGAPDILPEVNLISLAAKLGDPRYLRAELSIYREA